MKRLFFLAALALCAVFHNAGAQTSTASSSEREVVVLTYKTNAYTEPRSTSPIVKTYAFNTRVRVLEQKGPYFKVVPMEGGEPGYALVSHFIPASPNVVIDLKAPVAIPTAADTPVAGSNLTPLAEAELPAPPTRTASVVDVKAQPVAPVAPVVSETPAEPTLIPVNPRPAPSRPAAQPTRQPTTQPTEQPAMIPATLRPNIAQPQVVYTTPEATPAKPATPEATPADDAPTMPNVLPRPRKPLLTLDLGGGTATPLSALFRQSYSRGTNGNLRLSLRAFGPLRLTGRAAFNKFYLNVETLPSSIETTEDTWGTFNVLSGAGGLEWTLLHGRRIGFALLAEAGLHRMSFSGLERNGNALRMGERTEIGFGFSGRFNLSPSSTASLFIEPGYEIVRVADVQNIHYIPVRFGITANVLR